MGTGCESLENHSPVGSFLRLWVASAAGGGGSGAAGERSVVGSCSNPAAGAAPAVCSFAGTAGAVFSFDPPSITTDGTFAASGVFAGVTSTEPDVGGCVGVLRGSRVFGPNDVSACVSFSDGERGAGAGVAAGAGVVAGPIDCTG